MSRFNGIGRQDGFQGQGAGPLRGGCGRGAGRLGRGREGAGRQGQGQGRQGAGCQGGFRSSGAGQDGNFIEACIARLQAKIEMLQKRLSTMKSNTGF